MGNYKIITILERNMKLKTLKDMEIFWDCNVDKEDTINTVGCNQLKQEAIKWIKKIDYPLECNGKIIFIGRCPCNAEHKYFPKEHITEWIKHFFNITDEDLE